MELVLCLTYSHLGVRDSLQVCSSCKTCLTEYRPSYLASPSNYYCVKQVFNALKKLRRRRNLSKVNSWKRKLHTDDEVILIRF